MFQMMCGVWLFLAIRFDSDDRLKGAIEKRAIDGQLTYWQKLLVDRKRAQIFQSDP